LSPFFFFISIFLISIYPLFSSFPFFFSLPIPCSVFVSFGGQLCPFTKATFDNIREKKMKNLAEKIRRQKKGMKDFFVQKCSNFGQVVYFSNNQTGKKYGARQNVICNSVINSPALFVVTSLA
jgi:hypothetical protein